MTHFQTDPKYIPPYNPFEKYTNGSNPPNDKTFIEVYKCDVNFDFLVNTRPYLF